MSDQESAVHNRRESFRIDDTVTLSVRILDKEAFESINADFNSYRLRCCLKSHLQNQHDSRKPRLALIKNKNPEIAEYLESLEVQMIHLAERLDQISDSPDDAKKITGRVSLSSSGIRFCTDMPLSKGKVVELGMILSTQNCQVVMLGDVLRVECGPENTIDVSIRYTHIHPEDKETVIRHMARLQQLELQGRQRIG